MSEKLEYYYDCPPLEPCVAQIKQAGVVMGAGINKEDTGCAVIWDIPELEPGCYVFSVVEGFGTANESRVSSLCDFEINPEYTPPAGDGDPSCCLRQDWANRRL